MRQSQGHWTLEEKTVVRVAAQRFDVVARELMPYLPGRSIYGIRSQLLRVRGHSVRPEVVRSVESVPDRIRAIVRRISDEQLIPYARIIAGGRDPKECAARDAALCECYELLAPSGERAFSLARLGRVFGQRHHATVLCAIRRHRGRVG